jgi:DNA-binding response OmpR family regulator
MSDRALRVLLVEDEALNRALVRAVLDRRAAELPPLVLVEAETLDAARRALADDPADIVLLDVRLPDGSGLDLARELRDGRDVAVTPAVAILSASVLALERVAAESAGADAFLGKPFVPTELTALIHRLSAMVEERRGQA